MIDQRRHLHTCAKKYKARWFFNFQKSPNQRFSLRFTAKVSSLKWPSQLSNMSSSSPRHHRHPAWRQNQKIFSIISINNQNNFLLIFHLIWCTTWCNTWLWLTATTVQLHVPYQFAPHCRAWHLMIIADHAVCCNSLIMLDIITKPWTTENFLLFLSCNHSSIFLFKLFHSKSSLHCLYSKDNSRIDWFCARDSNASCCQTGYAARATKAIGIQYMIQ